MLTSPQSRQTTSSSAEAAYPFLRQFFRWALIVAAVLPSLFFFLAVQHSVIIFPFWDHCEFIHEFAKLHDQTFQLGDLWAPHNHSRLLVARAIVLANGLLTNWDIGSEYVYLEGSVALSFLLQALCLRRLCGAWSLRCLVLVSILSVFSFSPAGHNNHWWSFMLQLDVTHLLIIMAFLPLCLRPRAWGSNLIAAVACWLAAYTLGNGLVALIAAALAVHLSSRPLIRFDKFSLFWILNIVTILFLYLPGLSETASSSQNVWKLLAFCAAYLGSPVATLWAFPYRNMFDVPPVTLRNAAVGVSVMVAALLFAAVLWKRIMAAVPSALLFVTFALFAIGSAFLTGLGRAEFDSVGIANANASRYTIFATYLIYALIYASTDLRRDDLPEWIRQGVSWQFLKTAAVALFVLFLCVSANSYVKSGKIYREAHNFNQQLAAAFWGDYQSNQKFVYPNSERLKLMVAELRRLRIGPYRFVHRDENDEIETMASHKTVDQFGVNGLRDLPGLGRVLFSNPASRFEMPVTASDRSLHFSFGLVDNAITTTPTLAGVEFRVIEKKSTGVEKILWSRKLTPVSTPQDRGVQSDRVNIAIAGQSELVFETLAVADPQGCWAYWRDVGLGN